MAMSPSDKVRAKAQAGRGYVRFAVGGLVILVGSVVFAQDAPAPSPTDAPAPSPSASPAPAPAPSGSPSPAAGGDEVTGTGAPGDDAAGDVGVDVDVSFKKTANISASEMIDTGKGYIDDLQAALSRIVQLQEVAKKAGDVIKLNCVNDKLLQIKELLNIAEGALTNITEAIARNDEDERYHQFSRLTIAHQKGEQVKQEGENCIGEDLVYVGDTEIQTDVDPNIPGTDPPDPVGAEPIVVERPPVSSPDR
jgi:hypothetical protein